MHGYHGALGPRDMSDKGIASLSLNVRYQGYNKKSNEAKHKGLLAIGVKDINSYYYRYVYAETYIAIEYVAKHKRINPNIFGIKGCSQGGAISLATAALNKRIVFVASVDPRFCDWKLNIEAYFPDSFYSIFYKIADESKQYTREQILGNLAYFDSINFCKRVTVPVLMVNDMTSYPEGICRAFNAIPIADKQLFVYPTAPHCYIGADYRKVLDRAIKQYLK